MDFHNKSAGVHCCAVVGLRGGHKFVGGFSAGTSCSARRGCSGTGFHAGLSVSLSPGAGVRTGVVKVLGRFDHPNVNDSGLVDGLCRLPSTTFPVHARDNL